MWLQTPVNGIVNKSSFVDMMESEMEIEMYVDNLIKLEQSKVNKAIKWNKKKKEENQHIEKLIKIDRKEREWNENTRKSIDKRDKV